MNNRPVNLNFLTIRFPLAAIVSILHRISGIFLFLLIPLLLWMLQESLASETRWQLMHTLFRLPWVKAVTWVMLAGLIYHWIAGIRHLLLDMHVGETKTASRVSAFIVLSLSALLIIAVGYRLWL